MSDLNKFVGIGRLTRDVQLKFLPSQTAIAEFGFAMGRKFKTASGETKEETCFLDCSCFGKGGEILAQYVGKGSQLGVSGRLSLDQWDDKTTGQKRSKIKLIVEDFQFIGGKSGEQRQGGSRQGPSRAGGYGRDESSDPPPVQDVPDMLLNPEDSPF